MKLIMRHMELKNMTIGEIASLPAFHGFRYIIGEENPEMETMVNGVTVREMCNIIPVWNEDELLEGLEYVYDRAESDELAFHHINEEQKTGVLGFPLKQKAPCVFICAGGSYRHCCNIQEAFPTAKRLNEAGIAAFVVQYRTGEFFSFDGAINDLADAVSWVFENAESLQVDPQGYAVMGFSAGGTVAALWGCKHTGYQVHCLPKPGAIILGYPAISIRAMGDEEKESHFPEKLSNDAIARYSADENIDKDYPALFTWAFAHDTAVNPNKHGALLAERLEKAGVPVKSEIFEGAHGVGIGEHTAAKGWLNRAVDFWRAQYV